MLLCSFVAYIPAPIFFGYIFDTQCLLWSEDCDGLGACLEYNSKTLPFVVFGTTLGYKLFTYLFLLLTYMFSRQMDEQNKSNCDKSVYSSDSTCTTDISNSQVTVSTITEFSDIAYTAESTKL